MARDIRKRSFQRLSPLTPVVRGGIYLLAGLAAGRNDLVRGEFGFVAKIVIAGLAVGAAYGAAAWWLTKFWLAHDEVRVDTGVLHRKSRRVRIDRIQEIDLVQPFVARLFRLAEVRMDVAGGDEGEVRLAYLTVRHAEEVKQVLLRRRDQVRAQQAGETRTAPEEERRTLAAVPHVMQVMALAGTRESMGLLLCAPVIAFLVLTHAHPAFVSLAVPVVATLAIVLVRNLMENFGFVLSEDHLGLHVRRGMFDLSQQTISLTRLQGVVITEPWLWRRFGWARLDVSTAGSSGVGAGGPDASTVLWVGDRDFVVDLACRLLGGIEPDSLVLRRTPRRAVLVAPLTRWALAVAEHPLLLASRGGALVRRTHFVPHARVQSLRISQSPWQRLLRLATVHIDSPPGPVRLVALHRSDREAREIFEREVRAANSARLPAGRPLTV